MLFKISKEMLLGKLADVSSVIENNTPSVILSHIYLKAEYGKLILTATDTELTLSAIIEAEVIESGSITVPGKSFTQLVQRLANSSLITCSIENEQFLIETGRSKFKLQTLPADDFPLVKNIEDGKKITLDASYLSYILTKVRFAMGSNDPRAYLNGLYFNNISSDRVETAATDGHRLATASCKLIGELEDDEKLSLIIPAKAVNALVGQISLQSEINQLNLQKESANDVETVNKLNDKIKQLRDLSKQDQKKQADIQSREVSLVLGERDLELDNGNFKLTTRLLDGKYPEYSRIIPNMQQNPILIDRLSLLDALKRFEVVLNHKDEKGLVLRFKENTVSLFGRNRSNDTGDEQIDIVNTQNINCEIGINVMYLAEAASNIDGDNLQLHIENSDKPILITTEYDKDIKYIIMPMRI